MASKSRDHVDRPGGAFLPVAGPAQSLAINGDHIARNPSEACHPGHKTALKHLRIKAGKDVAEMIVGGSPRQKWPETAQELQLFLAKPGDIDKSLRPRQDRDQTQQQHFIQLVDHLGLLAMIRHILEIA